MHFRAEKKLRYLHALLEVGALELAGEAGDRRAVGLVLLVEAVVVAVAHPRRRDAVPRARTRELDTNHMLVSYIRSWKQIYVRSYVLRRYDCITGHYDNQHL